MDKIIEFFQNLNFDKFISYLKDYRFWIVIAAIVLLIILSITVIIYYKKDYKRIALNYEDYNTRYFSIHYDEQYVYSVDDKTLTKKRKENLDWFYSSFIPQDKLRVIVWINALQKEDTKASNYLEVHTKIQFPKRNVYTILTVTSINYEKKIIHIESRIFPNIKKSRMELGRKLNIKNEKDMPTLLNERKDSPCTMFLCQLFTEENNSTKITNILVTILLSRLLKFTSKNRLICSTENNYITIVSFNSCTDVEVSSLGNKIAKEISRILFLSSISNNISFKIGIIKDSNREYDFYKLISIGEEITNYAYQNELSSNVIIYNQNMNYQIEQDSEDIDELKSVINENLFTQTITPILNTKGQIFGYDINFNVISDKIKSFEELQTIALENNYTFELESVFYRNAHSLFIGHAPKTNQHILFDIKPDCCNYIKDIIASNQSAKKAQTIFVLKDYDVNDDLITKLQELETSGINFALEITSTTLTLSAELMKIFPYFILRETTFDSNFTGQYLAFFSDMVNRISTYKGKIIATGISSWSNIEILLNLNVGLISSKQIAQSTAGMPTIDDKRIEKLISLKKENK